MIRLVPLAAPARPLPPTDPSGDPLALTGPDGAPPVGAAAFLATLEQYEGCPAEQLDDASVAQAWR